MPLALDHEDRKKYLAKMREEIYGHIENVFDLQPNVMINPQHPNLSGANAWLNRFFDELERYSAHLEHAPAIRTIDAIGTPAKGAIPVIDACASQPGEVK